MRKIKFRGWDAKRKRWVYGDLQHEAKRMLIWFNREPGLSKGRTTRTGITIAPGSVGEFTGLVDKNGKDIYEGDLYRKPVTCNKEVHGTFSIYEVVYLNGMWVGHYVASEKGAILPRGYTACSLDDERKNPSKDRMFYDDHRKLDEIEVVGNIRENIKHYPEFS